jgi:hypothetical protein
VPWRETKNSRRCAARKLAETKSPPVKRKTAALMGLAVFLFPGVPGVLEKKKTS